LDGRVVAGGDVCHAIPAQVVALAVATTTASAPPTPLISRLNNPAYDYPCQRVADALMNAHA
jgi:hypothetical protein